LALKKILLLSDWYEPGYKAGGPIQSARNFVMAMHDLYDISVLTTSTDLGESIAYPGIPTDQWVRRTPGIRVYYATKKTLTFSFLKHLMQAEHPDFIYINSLYSIRFSILPLILSWRKKIQAQVVLSPRGMLRESAISIKSTRKKWYLQLLNHLHIPERIRFHATDELERSDVIRYFPSAKKVDLIPNFSAALPLPGAPITKSPGILRCVYISRIMGIKNILFFLDVLKEVTPGNLIAFSIYGDIEDSSYWEEAQKIIKLLPGHITVSYNGSLPHAEVIPSIREHHLFILPTKGENFGHAIAESLSAGRPVLISNKTPWLGLREKEIGWDLAIDDVQPWVNALIEATAWDQPVFNHWSNNSRRFVEERSDQEKLKQDYIKLFS
jgi:glycosyltransferase involved in cell wall biosynthesis